MIIVDPRRMLAAFTFTPEPFYRCWLRGCYHGAIVGRRHRMYGLVDCCPMHDPERHGYALPLHQNGGTTEVPPVVSEPAPSIDGGSLVPVPVVPFNRPPSGQKVEINF